MKDEILKIKSNPVPQVNGYNIQAENYYRKGLATREFWKSIFWLFIWVPKYAKHQKIFLRLRIDDAYEAMKKNGSSPTLFLRSFNIDGESPSSLYDSAVEHLTLAQPFEIEQKMEMELRSFWSGKHTYGPPIAIGNPCDELPELGAFRFYVEDKYWKRVIIDAIERSQLVILRVGLSDGVFWELKALFALFPKERILLLFNCGKNSDRRLNSVYDEVKSYLETEHGIRLPERIGKSRMLRFNKDGSGALVKEFSSGRFGISLAPMIEALKHIPPDPQRKNEVFKAYENSLKKRERYSDFIKNIIDNSETSVLVTSPEKTVQCVENMNDKECMLILSKKGYRTVKKSVTRWIVKEPLGGRANINTLQELQDYTKSRIRA